ncbi:MAG: peptide ABC transporter ATP-binding protein, partial [Bacteroidetes bacterium]
TVFAVDDVSFRVFRGTTFGIVGESGCGKSTTAMSILRLIKPTSGSVRFDGNDVLKLDPKPLRRLRSRMQLIFQDPYSSLNPRATAGNIVAAPLKTHNIGSRQQHHERVSELFSRVGLRPEQQTAFPHQFSGGQRQRISIARALATDPELIVCDEPVSALDVAIQAQVLNLLIRLQRELNLTYLFISHDMGVIQHMCDEVVVLYLGKIVEQADRNSLFSHPLHPYTWSLLSAVPSIYSDADSLKQRVKLKGDPPSPIDPPPGCRFAQRCPFADTSKHCYSKMPLLRIIKGQHKVACHRVSEEGVAPQDIHTI